MTQARPLIATLAVLGTALFFVAPATEARAQDVCKRHAHVTTAIGFFPAMVRNRAIGKWQSEVRRHDGNRWSAFYLACNRTVRCERSAFPARQFARFVCTARGRPGRIE